MKIARPLKRLAITILLFAAATGVASAQATRTWVSGVGDDANPCSRTAPCKTFAGAISKTAAGGIIDALDPGGFGAVTITKSITLENIGEVASVLVSGTNAIIVNAAPTDTVVLRGISIEGLGTGIHGVNFLAGAKLTVENCTIQKFSQNGINFTPSGNAALVVTNSTINNNAGSGILVQGGASTTATSVGASLSKVNLIENGTGFQVVKGVAAIKDSAVNANTAFGIKALGTASLARISVDDTLVNDSLTGVGLISQGSQASIFLSRSTVAGNTTGVLPISSGLITSFGNNRLFGNSSSDGNFSSTVAER